MKRAGGQASAPMQLPISHVHLRSASTLAMVSLDEFLAVEGTLRAVLIVNGVAEFLDADGGVIPLEDALRSLRELDRRSTVPPAKPAEAA